MKAFTFAIALTLVVAVSASPLQDPAKKLVCYFRSLSVYRPANGTFDVEDIDPYLCTHLIYTFAGISSDGVLRILDEWNELEENFGRGAMRRFTDLKQQNPNLKTLLSIGGYDEGSINYSNMVQTAESRRRFMDSVLPFLQRYNFDGLDLHWLYPTQLGGRPSDKANFALLCGELRAEFDNLGLLLTAGVSGDETTIAQAYDIPSIARSLDFINVKAYDLHGAWEPYTGHHSQLRVMPSESGNTTKLNVENGIRYWIDGGCPAAKLIMGMAIYGRGFLLDDPAQNGLYAPARESLPAGPYTREPGVWGYNEILEKFATFFGQWSVVTNNNYVNTYAYMGRQWIGYDTVETVAAKSRYALEMGLGGGMAWSIETDDFKGRHSSETFPLIRTISRTLIGHAGTPPTPTGPTTPTPPPTTPRSTTTPPPNELCSADGFFPDPEDCEAFYRCFWDGAWLVWPLRCTPGTIFDPINQTCGWPDVVDRPECNDIRHSRLYRYKGSD